MPIPAQRVFNPQQVRNFGRFGDAVEVPALADVQTRSYDRFLQLDVRAKMFPRRRSGPYAWRIPAFFRNPSELLEEKNAITQVDKGPCDKPYNPNPQARIIITRSQKSKCFTLWQTSSGKFGAPARSWQPLLWR